MKKCYYKPNRTTIRHFRPSDIKRIIAKMRDQGVEEMEIRKAINAAWGMYLDDVSRGVLDPAQYLDALSTIRGILGLVDSAASGIADALGVVTYYLAFVPALEGAVAALESVASAMTILYQGVAQVDEVLSRIEAALALAVSE